MSEDYRQQQDQELEHLDKIFYTLKKVAHGMTGIDDAEFLATELSVNNFIDQIRKTLYEQT